MADEDGWTAHPSKRALDRRDILFGRVEPVLGRHYLVPLGLERRNRLAEARAISPDSVTEDDARFGRHGYSSLLRSASLDFSGHPLANEWCAVMERDALAFGCREKTNRVDVGQRDVIEVQHR